MMALDAANANASVNPNQAQADNFTMPTDLNSAMQQGYQNYLTQTQQINSINQPYLNNSYLSPQDFESNANLSSFYDGNYQNYKSAMEQINAPVTPQSFSDWQNNLNQSVFTDLPSNLPSNYSQALNLYANLNPYNSPFNATTMPAIGNPSPLDEFGQKWGTGDPSQFNQFYNTLYSNPQTTPTPLGNNMAQDTGMVAPGTPAAYGSGSDIIQGSLGNPNNAQTPTNPLSQYATNPTGGAAPTTTPNPLSQYSVTPTTNSPSTPNIGATAGSPSGGSFTQGAALPNITTTQSQATAAPQFYTDYLNQIAQQGAQAAQNSQYVGAQPLQQQAFDQTSQNVGNYQPALQNAINLAGSVGNSNLYQAVGDLGEANIRRNLAPQATAGLVGSGQFGSSRGATALGDTIANAELGVTAQQQAALQQDYANRLNASNALGNLAGQTQALGLGDVNALSTMGGQQQTIAQNQQNYPMSQLTNESALLRGYTMPTSTSSSYTGPIPGAYAASPLQQIAGLGALGAGISNTQLGQTLFGTADTTNPTTGAVIPGASGLIGKGLSALINSSSPSYNSLTGLTGNESTTPLSTDTSALDAASQYFQ